MKLSIIIAAYNVEKYIENCIKSCINQDINSSQYEIIVVNDGSTDNTLNILNKLQQNITNLVVIDQKNMGLGASRNKGIKNSKGNYLWLIDGDDYIESNILNNILKKIEHEKLEVLALDYLSVDENYKLISKNNSNFFFEDNIVSGSTFYKENFEQSYSWLFIFKKSLFTNYDIYFKTKINMQDSEILPKILIHANRVSFYQSTCYYYVQHQNSYTNSTNGEKRYQYFISIIEVENLLNDFLGTLQNDKNEMIIGLEKKIEVLNKIIFYHLVYYTYEREWLVKCIDLLKKNGLYPLAYNPKGKLVLIKFGMNKFPIFTKKIIDKYLKFKSEK